MTPLPLPPPHKSCNGGNSSGGFESTKTSENSLRLLIFPEQMNVKKYKSREFRCQLIRKWGKESMKHHFAVKSKRDAQDFEERKQQVSVYCNIYKCS